MRKIGACKIKYKLQYYFVDLNGHPPKVGGLGVTLRCLHHMHSHFTTVTTRAAPVVLAHGRIVTLKSPTFAPLEKNFGPLDRMRHALLSGTKQGYTALGSY